MTVSLPTREDYFQIGAQDALARSAQRPRAQRLSREAIFTPGTDINLILASQAAMMDEATRHLALRMAALYLDSAEGEDLDRLVGDRFSPDVFRKQAAPAVVTLRMERASPPSALEGVGFDVGDKVRTANGVEFELTRPVAFSEGSTGPVTVAAQAVLAGTGGNVQAGSLTEFRDTPDDPAITVTNTEPAVGGSDVESDESLRRRARDYLRTARRGILAAIEFGALTVSGVASATAEEVLNPTLGTPNGMVRLYIADRNGQSNAVLANAVRVALLEYRAAGIIVDVLTTAPNYQSIAYNLAFRSGTDTTSAINQLKAITVATVNLLAPQEPLLRSMLSSLARSVPGAIVPEDAVVAPGGDLYHAGGVPQVFKTSLARVTVNGL